MKPLSSVVTYLALAIIGFVGCQHGAGPPPVPLTPTPFPELGISTDNYPRVDGSTSTLPLQRIIACTILDAGFEWRHSEATDERQLVASDISEILLNENYHGEKKALCEYINRLISHRGTHESYVNLIQKRAELILVAREPTDDETRQATKAGVQLDFQPVALDAFVFLLNSKNPVVSLTLEQIRDIYSGQIRNWQAVGGPDAPIQPYQRTRNSGSQELMQKLLMKDRKMVDAPDVLIQTLMSAAFLRIDEDVHGIGYSVYFYQEFMSPPTEVKACAVNGILPTAGTIRFREYPLVTDVFVVVRRDLSPTDPALRLRNWLLEPAGQKVVEESGYVPIHASESPMPADATQSGKANK